MIEPHFNLNNYSWRWEGEIFKALYLHKMAACAARASGRTLHVLWGWGGGAIVLTLQLSTLTYRNFPKTNGGLEVQGRIGQTGLFFQGW